jgi:hypothetical protein
LFGSNQSETAIGSADATYLGACWAEGRRQSAVDSANNRRGRRAAANNVVLNLTGHAAWACRRPQGGKRAVDRPGFGVPPDGRRQPTIARGGASLQAIVRPITKPAKRTPAQNRDPETEMPRTAVNTGDFLDPLFRMGAEGWQWQGNKPLVGLDGIQERNGGIVCLSTFQMPVGHMFYRLASQKYQDDPVRFLDSPWWLEFEEFNKIRRFADMSGRGITNAVRTLCAVPYDWNDCDLVLRAELVKPVDAYRGPGRSADGNLGKKPEQRKDNDRWTADRNHPLEIYRVHQLYIPGFQLPIKSNYQNPYRGSLRLTDMLPV